VDELVADRERAVGEQDHLTRCVTVGRSVVVAACHRERRQRDDEGEEAPPSGRGRVSRGGMWSDVHGQVLGGGVGAGSATRWWGPGSAASSTPASTVTVASVSTSWLLTPRLDPG